MAKGKKSFVLEIFKSHGASVLAILFGIGLVTYQLTDQILVDDEWWSIHNYHFWGGYAPIRLYFKILSRIGGLSEWAIRIPFAMGWLCTVIMFAWWSRRFVGRRTSLFSLCLLVLSPLLITYSRFARPYIWTNFLALVAVFLFREWWEKKRKGLAVLYVASTILAGALQVVVLPFILAPFLFYLVLAFRKPRMGERINDIKRLVIIGAPLAFSLAAMVGFFYVRAPDGLAWRTGQDVLTLKAFLHTMRMFAGTIDVWPAWCISALAVLGFHRLLRHRRQIAMLLALSCVVLMASIAVSTPDGIHGAVVLSRYLLPLLPVYLLCVACGMTQIWDSVRRKTGSGKFVAALGVLIAITFYAGLFLKGPFPALLYHPNNWMANFLQLELGRTDELLKKSISPAPKFYYHLSTFPSSSITIAEAPWYFAMWANPFPYYQRIHRQRTVIGFTSGLCNGQAQLGELPSHYPGFSLRNFIYLADLSSIRCNNIDYVVFHRDLRSEVSLIEDTSWLRPLIDKISYDVPKYIEFYRLHFGDPIYEDSTIVVFDVNAKTSLPNATAGDS
jgi:hypothetical protein